MKYEKLRDAAKEEQRMKQYNETVLCKNKWDIAAEGYRKWWKDIEDQLQGISMILIDMAAIRIGHRVLDIATGYGEPAITAAKKVGTTASGYVLATDISYARDRAKLFGMQDIIDFRRGNFEEIELPHSFFDAAVCRWGLMHVSNLDKVLKRVHALLVQGGRFAASVWSSSSKVPMISLPTNIISRELKIQADNPETHRLFCLADMKILKHLFIQVGFTDIRIETAKVTFELYSSQEFVRIIQELKPEIHAILANLPASKSEEIQKAMTDAWLDLKYTDPLTGHLRLENETKCIVGRKDVR
jgi:ubiquinone/menaquinone biosynthesis C-methylase UbiE